jgi:hypothetical protein
MLAMPGLRAFSLAAKRGACGVSCDADGVFVGDIPLLQRPGAESPFWSVRPVAELNKELTTRYWLPIDITSKAGAFALIVHALNRGDFAMAAIAAVQMQFPNPPPLANGMEPSDATMRRAVELHRSGLLKDWDSAKHPRTGTPPNRAWFAPVSNSKDRDVQVAMAPDRNNPWKISADSEGGGEGDGGEESPRQAGSQAELPFPGGLPPQLAPFTGGKTSGIFQAPNSPPVELQSGYDGPAADMPDGSSGFDLITKSHVEGHAAALMRQEGISEGTLYINNPKICGSCTRWLPRMLPPGATLNVVLPDKTIMSFEGIDP